MNNEPFLKNFSTILKLMSLVVIIIISIFIFNLLGIVISLPFWGTEAMMAFTGNISLKINENINFYKYLQIVNQIGMFIIPSILFAFLVKGRISAYLKINRIPDLFTLLAGVLVIIVSMPFVNYLVSLNESLHLPSALSEIEDWMRKSEDSAEIFTNAFLKGTSISGFLLNIVMIAILPAIGEEFLFRGVLQKQFKDLLGNVHIAIFVSAFLFSAMHLQFFGFFPRMVLGLLLGYMFYFSNNLWVPIIGHFFNNAFAVTVSFLNNKKIIQTDIDTMGNAGDNYFLIIVSLILTLILLIIILKIEEKSKKKEENKIPSSL